MTNVAEAQPLKKFKFIWDERVTNGEGDFLYFDKKEQIIESINMDEAEKIWKAENEDSDNNGLEDCYEVIEHPLLEKQLMVQMPDGLTYGIPVEVIARDRAEYYAINKFDGIDRFGGDVGLSLSSDTLPLFISDENQIFEWAKTKMKWTDVKKEARVYQKKVNVTAEECQNIWATGDHKLV
ncbi:TPA: hypothetical protein ACGIK9_003319 [Acinetobacter baumannii]|uniref:hypothetical protein n=1 Tax=Acinetobacter baumannii TaxID=470 RepID=UPI00338F1982